MRTCDHFGASSPCEVCARIKADREEYERVDLPYVEAAKEHETDRVLLSNAVAHTEDGAYVSAWIWVPHKDARAAQTAGRES